jgi:hypothetical protein
MYKDDHDSDMYFSSFYHTWDWTQGLTIVSQALSLEPYLQCIIANILSLFFFCSSGVWTQGLHLEPPYQPFFVMGFFPR